MSDFKEGDKVRVTFVGEVILVDGALVEVVTGDYVLPLDLSGEGVTVVPAGELDRFERALTVLADKVADLETAAKRSDDAGRPGVAIERRTEADAVRLALVAVIEVGGVETDKAIVRAHTLIAEAVAK